MYFHRSFKLALVSSSVTFVCLLLTSVFFFQTFRIQWKLAQTNVTNPPKPNLSVRASSVNYTDFIPQVWPTAAHITHWEIHNFGSVSLWFSSKNVLDITKKRFISHLLFSTGVCWCETCCCGQHWLLHFALHWTPALLNRAMISQPPGTVLTCGAHPAASNHYARKLLYVPVTGTSGNVT